MIALAAFIGQATPTFANGNPTGLNPIAGRSICTDDQHARKFDRMMKATRDDEIDRQQFQRYLDDFLACEHSRP
jgi:hypothetical protein